MNNEKFARLSTLTEPIYLSHVFFLMHAQKLCMIKICVSQVGAAILFAGPTAKWIYRFLIQKARKILFLLFKGFFLYQIVIAIWKLAPPGMELLAGQVQTLRGAQGPALWLGKQDIYIWPQAMPRPRCGWEATMFACGWGEHPWELFLERWVGRALCDPRLQASSAYSVDPEDLAYQSQNQR